ncbi:MAG: hypothetical protein Q4A55_01020 [Aerococcus sp.]|nr:hypothetical protein [Aerococcus sp.]
MFRQRLKHFREQLTTAIHRHPYIAMILVLIIANLVGILIQRQALGFVDFSRLSTTLTITVLALVAVAAKQRRDKRK